MAKTVYWNGAQSIEQIDKALQLAGAEVIIYQVFGCYQGNWVAKVRYHGSTGWIVGNYGSCSGCDTIEAINSNYGFAEIMGSQEEEVYNEELAQVGREYLAKVTSAEAILDQEQMQYYEPELYEFIRAHMN